jgi:hypothetical protein
MSVKSWAIGEKAPPVVDIYNVNRQIVVERNGQPCRYTSLKLKLDVRDTETTQILFVTYMTEHEGQNEIFTADKVSFINLVTSHGYSITGTGISPRISYQGQFLGMIQGLELEMRTMTFPLCSLKFHMVDTFNGTTNQAFDGRLSPAGMLV